ncbi:5357_t:CDS:2 [Ambispora leptoticha]|uniref:5357_t:CDS:1 n=1 Tax=Ambispora leptoticha TaxID=144679 RepID=A0A9N8WD10_9GLOM|nr:5357_t:CDS:2 [Ambispora leptoticha]
MAQPYRIQDCRSGKRIQPQSIYDNNTGVARNRFSRRGDKISRTTSSKNSGRSDVIRFNVEEAGETSMNSNEPSTYVPPENSNNSSSQNVTQNAIKQPNIMENQTEIRRRIHLYGQICPQTEEERKYSPSPREGFTTDLDKDTIVICSRRNHGMENGMCVLYCGFGTLYKKDRISFCRVCKEYIAKDEVTRLSFNYLKYNIY